MLVKTGVGVMPNNNLAEIARNPFVNPIDVARDQYVMWNWLSPFIAWLIGARSPSAYIVLNMAFSAAFVAMFIVLALKRSEPEAARTALALFAMLPVSTTAIYWVGYDSLTLLLILIALAFPGRSAVAALAGFFLGAQHFEQGFAGAAALTLATALSRWRKEATTYPIAHGAAFLVGVALGKISLIVIFHLAGIEVKGGRLDWLAGSLGKLPSEFALAFQFILYSVFGVGWLAAIKFWDNGRNRLPFFIALVGLSLLLPVNADQTRVIAIITFPLVLAYWLFEPGFLASISRREAAVAFLVWMITPWAWVWQGVPRLSAFSHDLFPGF